MAVARGRTARAALLLALVVPATLCFTGALAPASQGRTARAAEAATGSSGSSSVALVKVTKENSIATAGVLGGVTGLLLGGFWIGAAGFVATSYLAKKEDSDVATVLKGVSSASLEAINFVDYLNSKYDVTSKVGTALNDALEKSDSETTSTVKGSLDTVGDAITSFDKDVGIKDTLGSLILSGTDLANQLAAKVVELNDQYKVTDQIKAKIDESLESKAEKECLPFAFLVLQRVVLPESKWCYMWTDVAKLGQHGAPLQEEQDVVRVDANGIELATALQEAAARVSEIIERAEWLLDPTSAEAKSAAEGARSFVKLFFDEGQARSPEALHSAAKDLPRLVVDGFDREQIWEEMEVQNVPLRQHLRKRVSKLAVAPKGAIDLTLAASQPVLEDDRAEAAFDTAEDAEETLKEARAKKSTKKGRPAEAAAEKEEQEALPDELIEPQEADTSGKEDFFSLEDMEKFADMADKGTMRLDEDADESDFDLLEAGDGDEGDDAVNAKFSDFFGAPDSKVAKPAGKAAKASQERKAELMQEEEEEEDEALDEGEEEEEEAEGDLEELDEEEKALEAQLKALQSQGDQDDEGEEEEEKEVDEEGEVSGNEEDADAAGKRKPKAKEKSLYEMDRRLQSLEEEVRKLEEEQLQEKSWEMKGEVTARHRPLNSLLEVALDQPMTHFAARRAEETAGDAELDEQALEDAPGADAAAARRPKLDLEAIIKQRIWDESYDDVVRKAQLPPSQRPQGADEDAVETLNFEKSRVGLGDIYAKQYEAEMLGHQTDQQKAEDKEKAELKQLFAKLMYKLDLLSNAHFTPRPPMAGTSAEGLKVPSLKMEETIPLMVSDATLQAPEERKAPRRHVKDQAELTPDEKAAVRRTRKAARSKRLQDKVESGEMSLAGRRERDAKLQEKNKAAKEEKAARGQVKEQKKRLKASELLSQAAENAKSDISKKDAVKKQREARPENTPASKRLKL
ncbi:MPHOSPH10 [Symbiodinium pilosum]|uniref:MPHOSPH10 protein n=1 Tax=Symbiodinium pilosum TaxID=2952 RepID=A0A812TMH7_SYMPI|nr:MPHOSPH10 [Symbiodinium pilosum]